LCFVNYLLKTDNDANGEKGGTNNAYKGRETSSGLKLVQEVVMKRVKADEIPEASLV
jgi:hypothetical protein